MNAHGAVPGKGSLCSASSPSELSDCDLLTATRQLVGRSNQLLAALLGHLSEVEARGLHRTRACSSLYTYCIYELRFSEDEAFRRVAAARLVRRFPVLLDAVASGELHLTGLLMLGPHLTAENLPEVLARAKHRTKKEIARLVRRLDPLPDVPARIEPLGPAPARVVTATPSWGHFAESLCPIRELTAGDRPREWIQSDDTLNAIEGSTDIGLSEADAKTKTETETELPAPARLEPERYRVQFTAGDEYVKLVEKAQALLSHSVERVPSTNSTCARCAPSSASSSGRSVPRRSAAEWRVPRSRWRSSLLRYTTNARSNSLKPRATISGRQQLAPARSTRASATGMSPPPCAAPSSSGTRGVARVRRRLRAALSRDASARAASLGALREGRPACAGQSRAPLPRA